MGIKGANGLVYYPVEKRVIFATSKEEARSILKKFDERQKNTIRKEMKFRPKNEVEKLIRQVFYRNGLIVRKFSINNVLCI